MTRHLLTTLSLLLLPLTLTGASRTLSPQIRSLQVVANQDWLSPPVIRLGSDDVIHVAFDELSHNFHRYVYRLEHCEEDWTPSEEIFESDWLEGFNDNIIDDYQNSVNTTVAYTHYTLQIPNERCRLTMSGNYRLHILDEDQEDEEVAVAEFRVTEESMTLLLAATTNTDIDTNGSHQQLSMSLGFGSNVVTRPDEQIRTVVMQNQREDNLRRNVGPNLTSTNGLEWTHNRQLIFQGGNEYHKFEVLDPSHPTMGIDFIRWDGTYFQVWPYLNEPRPNYIYDEDADGAFYIRNSDNVENDTASDYVWINYRLKAPRLPEGCVVIDGQWATSADDRYQYVMTYNEAESLYTARILQKQGYYSYQYLWLKDDGTTHLLPSEGNFFETENRYQAFVYYKGTGERTWRLVAYRQIELK